MQVITRQMGGLGIGGKQGGLQDMIKDATAENIPGPDWVLNRAIVEYINRSPNRRVSLPRLIDQIVVMHQDIFLHLYDSFGIQFPKLNACRGSEKAFKYLKARFIQTHVKVQNLTLLVSTAPPTTPHAHIST